MDTTTAEWGQRCRLLKPILPRKRTIRLTGQFGKSEGYGEKFHLVHGKFGYGIRRLRELKDVRDRLIAKHEK